MKKAFKRHGSPDKITTDGLRSHGAAMNEFGCRQKQEVGRWANNRVENSHLPFRRRERAMNRFRRMSSLQKFATVHANLHNHFSLDRHLIGRRCGDVSPQRPHSTPPAKHSHFAANARLAAKVIFFDR
jgi:putative transposase